MVVLQNSPIGFIVKLMFVLLKGVAAEVFGFGEILKGEVGEGSFGFIEEGHWSLGLRNGNMVETMNECDDKSGMIKCIEENK
jgi:hypothetical protein